MLLLEVKHGIEQKHVDSVKKKKAVFDKERDNLPAFKDFDTVLVGVGGTHFPKALRDQCVEEGFFVVYPCGGRYCVQSLGTHSEDLEFLVESH